jgi:branched-chain amino acid aminotransferase
MANIDWDKLGFDAYETKTVIMSHYKDGQWSPIKKSDDFSFTFDPFAAVFHYATSCFEGLKAFRQADGRVCMFRPEENARRLQRTADYLGLPIPSEDMFIQMCSMCVKENIEFLPPYGHQASLYVRPLLIGMRPQMQLIPPTECVFAVMCAPAGSYYGEHLSSFSAVIPRDYDRAAPQGSGSYKIGANYACSFKPYKIAHSQGYTEILYLNSATKEYIDEFGSSNFFAIKGNKYITPLSDSVLPSITNKSLQQVAQDFGMTVEKRKIRVEELADFEEAAACGTAVVITPMSHIDDKPHIAGSEITHTYRFFPDGTVGPVCTKFYKRITGIQFGELPDTHGWCHYIEM